MERLTDKKVAADLKRNVDGLRAAGVEPSMSDLRYIKLAEYENEEELQIHTQWPKENPYLKSPLFMNEVNGIRMEGD